MIDANIQFDTHTAYNRYPREFLSARNWVAIRSQKNLPELKILSFGCSTGEELLSLSSYFPGAKLYGCDINKDVLDRARKLCPDSAKIFLSSEENMEENGPFDLIFCMSVLCVHGKNSRQIRDLLPFERFQQITETLDRHLTDGGMLVLFNTSYFFHETSVFDRYVPIHSGAITENSYINRFDKNHNQVVTRQKVGDQGIYKLLVPLGSIKDQFLTDTLFEKNSESKDIQAFVIPGGTFPEPNILSINKKVQHGVNFDDDIKSYFIEKFGHIESVSSSDGSKFNRYTVVRRSVERDSYYLHGIWYERPPR